MSPSWWAECIGPSKQTRGSETSQYPEEKTSIEIPQVVASERGVARLTSPEEGPRAKDCSRMVLGRPARAGDSPVGETVFGVRLSRAGLEKPRSKMGGPPSKAKYSQMTDSEPVP